jgi:hypothetical protein
MDELGHIPIVSVLVRRGDGLTHFEEETGCVGYIDVCGIDTVR